MNDTRNEIIRIGSELIRSVGYNAFSYADIAKVLNIKNAAIHYYFPTKSDLGEVIIGYVLLVHLHLHLIRYQKICSKNYLS